MISIAFHSSQFPGRLSSQLAVALRHGSIPPKFLYTTPKQTERWLELHQAYSPARRDPDCVKIYQASTVAATAGLKARHDLVALGPGSAHKEARIWAAVPPNRRGEARAVDVGPAILLEAAERFQKQGLPAIQLIAADLARLSSEALLELLPKSKVPRLFTFFGMLPNLERVQARRLLKGLLRKGDTLLLSANLLPDGGKESNQIFQQYANPHTTSWLMAMVEELGLEASSGRIQYDWEMVRGEPQRIVAHWIFERNVATVIDHHRFTFRKGGRLRLFHSYRDTKSSVLSLLETCELQCSQEWIAGSGEEGVFWCKLET